MKVKKSSLNKVIYDLIDLPDNAKILDLGCGNAGYLIGIMNTYPNKIAKAIGIDVSSRKFDMIPYTSPIELKVMNCAEKLDFPDNEFDFVFTKDLLECITDKKSFIKEIHRILKPNGLVICVHADFDSTIYNGENKDLITKAIHAYAVTKQGWMDDLDGWMGRRLYGYFNNCNLFDGDISIHNVIETEYCEGKFGYEFSKNIGFLAQEKTGALSDEEYMQFINELVKANENGTYFYSKPYYIYKGYKKN